MGGSGFRVYHGVGMKARTHVDREEDAPRDDWHQVSKHLCEVLGLRQLLAEMMGKCQRSGVWEAVDER
jgi:hypothetical protein